MRRELAYSCMPQLNIHSAHVCRCWSERERERQSECRLINLIPFWFESGSRVRGELNVTFVGVLIVRFLSPLNFLPSSSSSSSSSFRKRTISVFCVLQLGFLSAFRQVFFSHPRTFLLLFRRLKKRNKRSHLIVIFNDDVIKIPRSFHAAFSRVPSSSGSSYYVRNRGATHY